MKVGCSKHTLVESSLVARVVEVGVVIVASLALVLVVASLIGVIIARGVVVACKTPHPSCLQIPTKRQQKPLQY